MVQDSAQLIPGFSWGDKNIFIQLLQNSFLVFGGQHNGGRTELQKQLEHHTWHGEISSHSSAPWNDVVRWD